MIGQFMENSVTGWFLALKDGDAAAANNLWARYFKRVVALVSDKLVRDPAYEAEDLALSVFDCLFRAAEDGRYQDLGSRDELWSLMLVCARNKWINHTNKMAAAKRSAENTRRMSASSAVTSPEPTAEESAIFEEECGRLVGLLKDSTLQSIALLRMDGNLVADIARQIGRSERTVKRKLMLIRKRWEQEV